MTTTYVASSGSVPWIYKDPDAVLDYELDWNDTGDSWLGSDTITGTPSWTIDPVVALVGLTKTAQTNTTTTTTIWLSGGVLGASYTITCRIVTAGGRTEDRSFRVVCTDR